MSSEDENDRKDERISWEEFSSWHCPVKPDYIGQIIQGLRIFGFCLIALAFLIFVSLLLSFLSPQLIPIMSNLVYSQTGVVVGALIVSAFLGIVIAIVSNRVLEFHQEKLEEDPPKDLVLQSFLKRLYRDGFFSFVKDEQDFKCDIEKIRNRVYEVAFSIEDKSLSEISDELKKAALGIGCDFGSEIKENFKWRSFSSKDYRYIMTLVADRPERIWG